MNKNIVLRTKKVISNDSEGIYDEHLIRAFENIGATHIGVYLNAQQEDLYFLMEATLVESHIARYDNIANNLDECTGSYLANKYIMVHG